MGNALTWVDKLEVEAEARGLLTGRQQGKQQGMQEILLRQLQQRFAPLPASVIQRVSALESTEELTRLAERVLSARSLEELGMA